MAALAMPLELIRASHHIARLAKKSFVLAFSFEGLAIKPYEFGLKIKRINVADSARAKDLHDPLGFRWKMRPPRANARSRGYGRGCFRRARFPVRHPRQSDPTDAAGGCPEKVSP